MKHQKGAKELESWLSSSAVHGSHHLLRADHTSSTSVFGLEALVVSLVLDELDERHLRFFQSTKEFSDLTFA